MRGMATQRRALFTDAPPPLERRRVVVTGLGMITPHGVETQSSWEGMLSGTSAVQRLDDDAYKGQPCSVAALVPRGKGAGKFDPDGVEGFPSSRTAPFVQYAIIAADQALRDAGLESTLTPAQSRSFAVCVGTGIGSLDDVVASGVLVNAGSSRKVSPFFVPKVLANMAAAQISLKYGLRGPIHSMVTACAAGAHNIMDAARLIATGEADAAICGSSEACVSPLSITGFARAKSLATNFNDAPNLASRPFDKERCGFVMGEGAGMLVLEELSHAKKRGARIYCELRGWGSSGDAFHVTAPAEDGEGAARAMEQALLRGGCLPHQVGHINCHATSTPVGDACEARAVLKLFASPSSGQLSPMLLTSLKGGMGHLLGAAGAVEAAATVLTLHHRLVPPTANFREASEDIPREIVDTVAVAPGGTPMPELEAALCNSFGFGGVNASLLFSRLE
jgi:3-oxoacyl-[acyl-carrier-protein] synthase II